MHTDDSDDMAQIGTFLVPTVGPLRLIALEPPATPQRRRTPRRRLVQAMLFERRRTDRRSSKPGIDGLLRTVLADDWK